MSGLFDTCSSAADLFLTDRSGDRRLLFRFLEQLHQLIFPQAGDGVAAVAARFVAEWNHDRAAVRHTLDLALEDAELGRIDQVVGRIDGEKRCANFFQVRSGIVIM